MKNKPWKSLKPYNHQNSGNKSSQYIKKSTAFYIKTLNFHNPAAVTAKKI